MTAHRVPTGLALAAWLLAACTSRPDPAAGAAPRPAPRMTLVHVAAGPGAGGPGEAFAAGEPVHLVLTVGSIPAGTLARVRVRDEAGRLAWSRELPVRPGRPALTFAIDAGALPAGAYRAEATLGVAPVDVRPFRVLGKPPDPR